MKNLTSNESVSIILGGGVGILPTDTLYGLVASAKNPAGVERMYTLKNREKKPGTLIAANVQQLIELGLDEAKLSEVASLWPNPLSIVLPVEGLAYLHQGLDELAVRIPANENTRDLLLETGPLMTSSANQPGEPSAITIEMAYDYFKDSVDFYVDGGNLAEKLPSTIISFNNGTITVLRQGAISEQELLGLMP